MPTKDPEKKRRNNRASYRRHAEAVKRKTAEYRQNKRLSSHVSDEELDWRAIQAMEGGYEQSGNGR
jgi:hypothetical protein